MIRTMLISCLGCVFAAAAFPSNAASDEQPDPAELAGCHAASNSAWIRAQVAAGRAPLLVLDDEPRGPLRYDARRCEALPWRGLQVAEIRLLRPAAARQVYGAAASEGAVIVETMPVRTRRR